MYSNVPLRIVAASWLLAAGCAGPAESDADPVDTDEQVGGDQQAPTVIATSPEADEQEVALNRPIRVTFDEDVEASSLEGAIVVTAGGQEIPGTTTLVGRTATFTPDEWFDARTDVTARVTTAVTDRAGNALEEEHVLAFVTGDEADLDAPLVLSTTPANYATDIAVTRSVGVWFDEPPDPDSVNVTTFAVTVDGAPVDGTFVVEGLSATFVPDALLSEDTRYDAVVSGVSDRAGNLLAEPYSWFFVTGTTEEAPGSIELQSAADFTVLAANAVISTGETVIDGNLGVSPGTTVEGFPPGEINGLSHVANATATQAQVHLSVAYDEAVARFGSSVPVSGDLGGQTLAPGLYTATAALDVLAGDLTLDGGGDTKAVWVFQVDGDLAVAPETSIALTGEARARNVYWQVAGAVTLGAGASSVGNVMASDDITLDTGAHLEGRALTTSGDVRIATGTVSPP